MEGYSNVSADNWLGVQPSNATTAQVLAAKQTSPFPYGTITTHTAEVAFLKVLDSAGAILPRRDAVDTRVVSEARTGIETYGGAYGAGKGIIDTQASLGPWPLYNSITAPADSDKDGMPDAWEISKGLNRYDAADGKKFDLSTGYTNVEVYLNNLK